MLRSGRVDGLSLASLVSDLAAAMLGLSLNWSLGHPWSVLTSTN